MRDVGRVYVGEGGGRLIFLFFIFFTNLKKKKRAQSIDFSAVMVCVQSKTKNKNR